MRLAGELLALELPWATWTALLLAGLSWLAGLAWLAGCPRVPLESALLTTGLRRITLLRLTRVTRKLWLAGLTGLTSLTWLAGMPLLRREWLLLGRLTGLSWLSLLRRERLLRLTPVLLRGRMRS